MDDNCNQTVVPTAASSSRRGASRRRLASSLAVMVVVGLAMSSLVSCTPTSNRTVGLQTFSKAGASPDTLARVDCIMYRESRYQNAVSHKNTNGTYDVGLFQLNSIHAARWRAVTGTSYWQNWRNPYLNARVALSLWTDAGLSPWRGGCRL